MKTRKISVPWAGVRGCNLERRKSVNMRPAAKGVLTVTGQPKALAYIEPDDVFAGCDRRGDKLFLFVVRRGQLTLLGYSCRDDFEYIDKDLMPVSAVTGLSATGDFLIISTPEGLRFLRYDADRYISIGAAPQLPVFSFGTTAVSDITATMPGVTLSGRYSAWSGRLLPDDEKVMTRAAVAAFSEMKKRAAAELRFINPVHLRAALRLFDGSLIWCNEHYLAGDGFAAVNTLTSVDLNANEGVAVAPAQLSVKAWKPTVSIVSPGIGDWKGLVKAVEIYAANEPDTLVDAAFRCETSQTGERKSFLRIMSDDYPRASAVAAIVNDDDYRLVASISDIDGFMRGEMVGLKSAGAGALGKPAFILDAAKSGKPLTPCPLIFPDNANVLSTVADKCFAGDIRYRLPLPSDYISFCSPAALHDGVAVADVAVELLTSPGRVTVAYNALYNQWSEQLLPLLTYPDPRAVKMTVQVVAAGKVYRFQTGLRPAASGDFAYAVEPEMKGFVLGETTEELSFVSGNVYEHRQAELLVSGNGNPLLWSRCSKAHNKGVRAVAPAIGIGSSWLLGRHSAYLFAADGIYLLSFDKHGCSGATQVSQRQVKSQKSVVMTDKAVAFVDVRNALCSLSGSCETVVELTLPEVSALGYSSAFRELLVQTDKELFAVCGEQMYEKSFGKMELRHVAGDCFLTNSNFIYTVEKEVASVVAVDAVSPQVELPEGKTADYIYWDFVHENVDVVLAVYGDNGRECHGRTISKLKVKGDVGFPIVHRLPYAHKRALRLQFCGRLPSGAVLRPCSVRLP